MLPILSTILLVSACSSDGTAERAADTGTYAPTSAILIPQPPVAGFDPKNFSNSATIDNEWFPLTPGRRLAYDGTTVEEGETLTHRVVHVVTDLTKTIGGVETRVLYELDISDGELQEAELAFFAQDDDGNVWLLGEYYELYEGKEFIGGRAWLYGHLDGVKAGIIMPAKPAISESFDSQGFVPPPYYWADLFRVVETGQVVELELGTYDNVMVVEETSVDELDLGVFQYKYYVSGVGVVKVGFEGEEQIQETLELVEDAQLSASELDSVRARALELENRAYVYGRTSALK